MSDAALKQVLTQLSKSAALRPLENREGVDMSKNKPAAKKIRL